LGVLRALRLSWVLTPAFHGCASFLNDAPSAAPPMASAALTFVQQGKLPHRRHCGIMAVGRSGQR
jgi:hypothetical protein